MIMNCPLVNERVVLVGRILEVRDIGGIVFIRLKDQDVDARVVVEKKYCRGIKLKTLKTGVFVKICGRLQVQNGFEEIRAESVDMCGTDNRDICSYSFLPMEKMDRLVIRSKVLQNVYGFMKKSKFLPVTSPTIVGNWIEGKTSTFSVDYFGTTKFLTLNNMLYHQIMLISGYKRIFEISKVFRQDATRPKKSLTEFSTLDISVAHYDGIYMMRFVEKMIKTILNNLSSEGILVPPITFEQITYAELCHLCHTESNSGAQLSSDERAYLDANFDSFVWISGFPESRRRFFVKSKDGVCKDYQLWYRGKGQFAAGSERETNLDCMKNKIQAEGKFVENYEDILSFFKSGVPEMCEIGFGIERFLMYVFGGTISDYVAFPRTGRTFKA